MDASQIIVNGRTLEAALPSSIEQFLISRQLPPKSVVVEHNGEAVAPSEFAGRLLQNGDRVEVVKIVAGG